MTDDASSSSPLRDIHDPREHFRKLVADAQGSLLDHIRVLGNAIDAMHHTVTEDDHHNGGIEAAKATQQLAFFVAQSMQEANRLGYAEGREERDISDAVYRGALTLLPRGFTRTEAIQEARILWDEVRRSVLEAQATVRAKQQAEATALVEQLVSNIGNGGKPEDTSP